MRTFRLVREIIAISFTVILRLEKSLRNPESTVEMLQNARNWAECRISPKHCVVLDCDIVLSELARVPYMPLSVAASAQVEDDHHRSDVIQIDCNRSNGVG